MTKTILFITFASSTMLWANAPTSTIVEKSIETKRDVRSIHKHQQDKINMKSHQTRQRDHKANKKHLQKKAERRHINREKKTSYEKNG